MDSEEQRVWSLSFGELDFVQGYRRTMRTGLALQLVHFRTYGYFPRALEDIEDNRIQYVEEQLGTHVHLYDLKSDASRRHRLDVLRHLGIRRSNERDRAELHDVLVEEGATSGPTIEPLIDFGFRWALQKEIFVPSRKIMERSVRSALHAFQEDFLAEVSGKVSKKSRVALEECLAEPRGAHGFLRLKDDVGAATLDSVLEAADRLAFIQGLDLPFGITDDVDPSWLRHFARRVEGETAYEMRRHAQEKRIGLLALYIMSRKSHLIDGLVDLLIDVVHRIGTKSRRKVIGRIAADIEKVHGKERLLVDIATAAMMTPNGKVSDVIFPVAGAAKLTAIIDEHRAKGTLDTRIQMVMRGSWASHYRRMLPSLLTVLSFRSNNESWRPILDALSLIARLNEEGRRVAPASLAPEGSVSRKWHDTVFDHRGRLSVISYELCVLTQLRDRIRAKKIWVEGADRYRNPDDDLIQMTTCQRISQKCARLTMPD